MQEISIWSQIRVQGFWLPVLHSDHTFLFIAMGKKSPPACHLVKYHIGRAKLSPKELKLAGYKLGNRKNSADSFWRMETYSPTLDVLIFGVVSGKLNCLQWCVLGGVQKTAIQDWPLKLGKSFLRISSAGMCLWGQIGTLWLDGLSVQWMYIPVFRCTLKAASFFKAFSHSKWSLKSLKLRAETLSYYIWHLCEWWKPECIYNASLLQEYGLGTNVCLDKIQLQGLVLLLHVKSVASL